MKKILLLVVLIIGWSCSKNTSVQAPITIPNPVRCDATIRWTNPTHREANAQGIEAPLGPTDLEKLTVYVGSTSMAPNDELAFILDVFQVYSLMWTIADLDPGEWFFQLTVTDTIGQESNRSNESTRTCP